MDTANIVSIGGFIGFSFFAGYAMGFFTRTFFNMLMFFIGGAFILLFALQYMEMISIDWSVIESQYDKVISIVIPYFGSFKAFVVANLASSAGFGLGFYKGYKR